MDAPIDPALLLTEKFTVGQPVSCKEDPVLLRGQGRYTEDLTRPGQLYGVMERSRLAHREIRAIDLEAAREIEGIRAIIINVELAAAGIRNMSAGPGKIVMNRRRRVRRTDQL